jgi:hypothetical protein
MMKKYIHNEVLSCFICTCVCMCTFPIASSIPIIIIIIFFLLLMVCELCLYEWYTIFIHFCLFVFVCKFNEVSGHKNIINNIMLGIILSVCVCIYIYIWTKCAFWWTKLSFLLSLSILLFIVLFPFFCTYTSNVWTMVISYTIYVYTIQQYKNLDLILFRLFTPSLFYFVESKCPHH